MKEPLVSIIITSYNYGRYLSGAIESALKQSYRNVEIAVVDDGSKDNTKDVAACYPVRYVFQKNQGVATARNNGIKQSKGEFFICLDADDKLYPKYVEKTVQQMARDSRIGFVCPANRVWNEDTEIENLWIPHNIHIKFGLFAGWVGALGSVLIRRAAFDRLKYGFDASLPIYEDLDLCFRLLLDGWKIGVTTEPLVWGRLHRDSRNSASIKTKKQVETFMNRKYRFIEPYRMAHSFYQSTFGRATCLMLHPFQYLEGIKKKTIVRSWVTSHDWTIPINREYAEEYAHEILLTVDKLVEWPRNKELHGYYAKRLRILESSLVNTILKDSTNQICS